MCICVLFRMHWVPSGVAAADFGTSQVACRQTSAPSHTRGERGRAPSSTRRHDPTVAIIKASWSLPRERTCPTIHRRYINIYDAPLFKIAQKERAPTRSSSLLWFFCFLFFFLQHSFLKQLWRSLIKSIEMCVLFVFSIYFYLYFLFCLLLLSLSSVHTSSALEAADV